ncbi:MAG: long-chain-fatty-acid--CoA ligase [Actinobacteria bacterium]|nr:long-chain-fatty-acid--CoA ligase [Actinomycetota bacterium]
MALNSLEWNVLRRMSIADVPRFTASRLPDKTAIVYRDTRITFKELNENCNRFANAFSSLGVGKGDCVAFMTHNCLQYIYAWYGLMKIGAVVVPLNFMLKGPEIEYIVNHSEPKLFFAEDVLAPAVAEVAGNLKTVEKFGYISLSGAEVPDGWMDIDTFLCTDDTSEPAVEIDADDTAALIYTSGTEAMPKGVMNTHQGFYISLLMGSADLNVTRQDIPILSFPLYHVAGKFFLNLCINTGATVILEYAPNPKEILELTQKEKITFWVYPPTVYQVMPTLPDFADYDISSVSKCVSFGALMPGALIEQWNKILPDAGWSNYYGQTESTPLGSMLHPEDFDRKSSSIGRPHVSLELRIMDDEGNMLPAGEVGEIVMRGPSVMKGYYKDEEKTAAALEGGWLHTGDMGKLDEEGFLYFIDRKKDVIKTGGENVSSQEVEGLLYKHDKVLQVAVIGLPHEHWIETVCACIVPNPGVELTEDEIISYSKEKMAGYKVPKKVVILSELPVNPSGKVLKRKLKEQILTKN